MKSFKISAYNAFQATGIFRLSSALYKNRALILGYHGGSIGDEWTYNPKLFMRATTFRSRIEVLIKENYKFISLDELTLTDFKDLPERSVCITFDDGWQSTLSELLPVLADYDIPSTLYLHTQKFVERTPLLNVAIRYLASKATRHQFTPEKWLPLGKKTYNIKQADDLSQLIFDMSTWMQTQSVSKDQIYDVLRKTATAMGAHGDGVEFRDGRFEYISANKIQLLAALNCRVELHGHQHHYPLGRPDEFNQDLIECRESILRAGLANPSHYCYPSGSFDGFASAVLTDNKIRSATTCLPGFVEAKSLLTPHYLPRFLDGEDVTKVEFDAEICGLSDLLRRILQKPLGRSFTN